jgi:hypothetical protein
LPAKRATQARTASGVESILARSASPLSLPLSLSLSLSSASIVICLRCTSNPATIAIGGLLSSSGLPTARRISR